MHRSSRSQWIANHQSVVIISVWFNSQRLVLTILFRVFLVSILHRFQRHWVTGSSSCSCSSLCVSDDHTNVIVSFAHCYWFLAYRVFLSMHLYFVVYGICKLHFTLGFSCPLHPAVISHHCLVFVVHTQTSYNLFFILRENFCYQ